MRSISLRLNRRGAILPLTVIVLALMAVAVAITYARISAERVTTSDLKAQQGAFAVAQSGLNRWLANVNGKPAYNPATWPANPIIQTVNYNDLPGGTAQVDVAMLRESTTTLLPAVYVITSRGRYTAAKRWNSRSPSAERTVATYAIWQIAPIKMPAAVTSLAGFTANGNSSHYSGIDRCGAMGNVAGLGVPGPLGQPGNFSGQAGTIDGDPEDAAKNIGTPGTGGTAKDTVAIDWAGIRAGTSLPPNTIYNGLNWPPMATPGMLDWPVTKVNGDLTMPASGKGILIVTGNLIWNGTPNKTWEGLVLVGGTLTGNGQSFIYGAVMTALNVKIGIPVPDFDVGNGTKTWQYDSCSLARALGKQGSVQRLRNGWTDTWSSY
jgi:hypothetical protein